jgi:hypothetical protein
VWVRGWRIVWRWGRAPWREPLLLLALVVAAAAPVFLWVAGDVWAATSEDDVAARIVDDAAVERLGVDIVVEGLLDAERLGAADAAIGRAVGRIDGVGPVDRLLASFRDLVTIDPAAPPVGPGVRILGSREALDNVVVVERSGDDEGVWISTWFADRHELGIGDLLAFQVPPRAALDPTTFEAGDVPYVHRVVAIYEPIWSEDPTFRLPPFWDGIPPEYVPRYNSVFSGPTDELLITTEDYFLERGLVGVARWRAPLVDPPRDYDGILALRDRYRSLEARLVTDGELGDAMVSITGGSGNQPDLRTDLFEVARSIERAASRLADPLGAARGGGTIIALVTAAAVGVLLVERRRAEFRLLVGEGRRAPRLALIVTGQLLTPFALGALIGVGAGLVGVRLFGSAVRLEWGAVDWVAVVAIAALALVIAAGIGGWWGGHALEPVPAVALRAAVGAAAVTLLAATAFVWIQVGRTTASAGELDLTVIALPVLLIATAVTIGLQLLRMVATSSGPLVARLPVVPMLAARRLGAGSAGLRVVTGALGIGVGLLAFSSVLTTTLDRTVEVKLATEVGGRSRVDLVDPIPDDVEIPGPSTVVAEFQTRMTPGSQRALVLAIDPDTFGAAVSWPDEFGISYSEVIELLDDDSIENVPAIALTAQSPRTSGAFGATVAYPYRIVADANGFPLADADRVTLMVSRPALEERIARRAGYESAAAAVAAGEPPELTGARQVLVSRAPVEEVLAVLDEAGVRTNEALSLLQRRNDPAIIASRSAFAYLGVLGVVAASCAVLALALFLSARRRDRALTMVMTSTMGLAAGRAAWITVLEVVVGGLFGALAGLIAAPIAVARLSDRFDPAPSLPPDVPVVIPWSAAAVVGAGVTVVVAGGLWWSERRSVRRAATVVRRG